MQQYRNAILIWQYKNSYIDEIYMILKISVSTLLKQQRVELARESALQGASVTMHRSNKALGRRGSEQVS